MRVASECESILTVRMRFRAGSSQSSSSVQSLPCFEAMLCAWLITTGVQAHLSNPIARNYDLAQQ